MPNDNKDKMSIFQKIQVILRGHFCFIDGVVDEINNASLTVSERAFLLEKLTKNIKAFLLNLVSYLDQVQKDVFDPEGKKMKESLIKIVKESPDTKDKETLLAFLKEVKGFIK